MNEKRKNDQRRKWWAVLFLLLTFSVQSIWRCWRVSYHAYFVEYFIDLQWLGDLVRALEVLSLYRDTRHEWYMFYRHWYNYKMWLLCMMLSLCLYLRYMKLSMWKSCIKINYYSILHTFCLKLSSTNIFVHCVIGHFVIITFIFYRYTVNWVTTSLRRWGFSFSHYLHLTPEVHGLTEVEMTNHTNKLVSVLVSSGFRWT